FPAESSDQPGENLYRVRIRDTRMAPLLQTEKRVPDFDIDVSALPLGVYTIELWWKGGNLTDQLIIE
ncbi:MAG: hypothetical protein WBH03_24325, partial [Cyclobacteriaceae bacterium]